MADNAQIVSDINAAVADLKDKADAIAALAAQIDAPAPGPAPAPAPEPSPEPTADASAAIQPVNSSAVQIALSVGNTEQQRWDGFGFSMDSPAQAAKNMDATMKKWPERLFEELNTKWLSGYGPSSNYQRVAALGAAHGVTGIICIGFVYRTPYSAASLADQMKSSGVAWTHVCLQNEPDGNTGNRFPGYPSNFATVVADNKALRARLDAIGLGAVKIIGNSYAHFGGIVDNEYAALSAEGLIPGTVTAGSGHCYHDCPSVSNWDNHWRSQSPQGLFETEAGYGNVPNSIARYLSALNNGCGVYFHFVGQAMATTTDALAQCLVDISGNRRPWHGPYKICNAALPLGARFRTVTSSDRPARLNAAQAAHGPRLWEVQPAHQRGRSEAPGRQVGHSYLQRDGWRWARESLPHGLLSGGPAAADRHDPRAVDLHRQLRWPAMPQERQSGRE
jgi:hypothetical protein